MKSIKNISEVVNLNKLARKGVSFGVKQDEGRGTCKVRAYVKKESLSLLRQTFIDQLEHFRIEILLQYCYLILSTSIRIYEVGVDMEGRYCSCVGAGL